MSRGSDEADRQPLGRGEHRVARQVDAQALGERAPARRPLLGHRGVQQPGPGPGAVDGGAGPRRDGPVVRVPGDAVRAEGQHGVRADVVEHRAEPRDRLVPVGPGALAVAVAQPVVLVDTEDLQAPRELPGALGGEPVRRPGDGIRGAALTAGRGHADDPLSVVAGQRHEAARQVRLVVGMGPDAQDRAQLGDVIRRDHGCSSPPGCRQRAPHRCLRAVSTGAGSRFRRQVRASAARHSSYSGAQRHGPPERVHSRQGSRDARSHLHRPARRGHRPRPERNSPAPARSLHRAVRSRLCGRAGRQGCGRTGPGCIRRTGPGPVDLRRRSRHDL